MAEEDIIIIGDDDEDVIVIDDNIDDVMIIEDDNIMEIDEADEDGSDIEVEPLEDSDYYSDNSDDSDELLQKKQRNLSLSKILTLNETSKMCCISYYYVEDGSKYCVDCFLRLSFLFLEARSEHGNIKLHLIAI